MSAQQTSTHGAPTSRTSSIAASAGLGVLAAAIGYLVSYVLIASEVSNELGEVSEWKGVAWYYYSGHLVDLEMSGSIAGFSGSSTVDLISQSGSSSATLLYVVPPLVLVLAGVALAYHWNVRDLNDAIVVGAPVTIGYLVVMTLGVFVAESSSEWAAYGIELSGSAAPELVPAILLAGVLYPLVFATAGAVATALVTSR